MDENKQSYLDGVKRMTWNHGADPTESSRDEVLDLGRPLFLSHGLWQDYNVESLEISEMSKISTSTINSAWESCWAKAQGNRKDTKVVMENDPEEDVRNLCLTSQYSFLAGRLRLKARSQRLNNKTPSALLVALCTKDIINT